MRPADILEWDRLVLEDKTLTPHGRLVALGISHRINSDTGSCFPSFRRIAQDNDIEIRSAKRLVADLAARGYLSIEHRPGNLNIYRLATPKGVTLVSPLSPVDHTQGVTLVSPGGDPGVTGRGDPGVTQKEQIERAKGKEEYAPALRDGRTPPVVTDEEQTDATAQPRKTAHRIPADWQPDEATRKWISAFGVTDSEAQPVITEFRQYWQGRTQKRTDWQLAFRRNGRAEGALVRLSDMKQRGTQARPLEKPRGPALRDARAVLAEIGLA